MKKASDFFGVIAGMGIVAVLILLCCLPWVDDVSFYLRVIGSLVGITFLCGLISTVIDQVIENDKEELRKRSVKSFKDRLQELVKEKE